MKLSIDEVRFKNFLSYGNKEQKVEFKEGLNLILGEVDETKRSNGSGKSSFIESIPFSLFGKTGRGVKKAEIINWKNRKGCEVRCDFSIGNDKYTIIRAIKPDNLEIYENGKLIPQPSDVRDYQKHLEENILHMDFKTFKSTIFCDINFSTPILTMKKPEKRAFIEKLFNLEIFTDIVAKSNTKIRQVNDKIMELKSNISSNEGIIEHIEGEIRDMESTIDSMMDHEEELKSLDKKVSESETKIEKYKDKKILVENRIEENRKKIVELGEKRVEINTKIDYIDKEIKSIEISLEKIKKTEKAREVLDGKRRFLDDSREESEIEAEIDRNLFDEKKAREKIGEREDGIHEIDKELSVLSSRLKERERDIKPIKSGVCPTCGADVEKSLLKEKNSEIGKLKNDIRKLESKKKDEDVHLRRAKKNLDGIKEEIRKLQKEKNDRKNLENEILKLEAEIKDSGNEKEFEENLDKTINERKYLTKNLDEIREESVEVKKIITKDERIIDIIEKKEDDFKKLLSDIIVLQKKIENEEEMRDSYKSMIKENRERINAKNSEIKEFEKKKKSLQSVLDYVEYIKSICKDDKVKQYAISSVMPIINNNTNHYLSETGHQFYTVIDKWIEGTIKGPGIKNASYSNLSGGERRAIDLSLQLSLMDVARLRSGIFPSLLIFDEIFDSSIDDYGIYRLMGIIHAKQREDGLKILLVSHRKEISDIDGISNKYFVTKKNGFSKIEEM